MKKLRKFFNILSPLAKFMLIASIIIIFLGLIGAIAITAGISSLIYSLFNLIGLGWFITWILVFVAKSILIVILVIIMLILLLRRIK